MTWALTQYDMTPSEIVLAFSDCAPVPVDKIAEDLGIVVVYDSSLSDDVSGKIERAHGAPSGYRITVNGRHHERRRRFTLAHEIAHYMLHRDLIGDGLTDNALYRSILRNGQEFADFREQEANQYAASILMPARAVKTQFSSGNCSIIGIAKAFNVSPAAAEIRMRQLHLGP